MKPTPAAVLPPPPPSKERARTRPRVRRETFFPHPPEKVWGALTDRRKLSRWLLPAEDDIRPEPGHRFGLTAPDGARIGCEVLEAETGRRLAFTWTPESGDAPPTVVTWTLTPEERGTRFTVEHDGALEGLTPGSGNALRLTACLEGWPAPRFRALPGHPAPSPVRYGAYQGGRRSRALNTRYSTLNTSVREVARCR